MKAINLTVLFLLLGFTEIVAQSKKHKVIAGETLYSIARFYEVSAEDLKKVNGLSDNRISIGQHLTIPEPGAAVGRSEAPAKSPGETTVKTAYHIVGQKETLFSIARRYGLSAPELRLYNNRPSDALAVGDTLWLNQKPILAESTGAAIPASISNAVGTHVVSKGETLFRIAQLYNTTIDELVKLNQLSGTDLPLGLHLKILNPKPVPALSGAQGEMHGRFSRHIVGGNETLNNILLRFQMDSLEFSALNPSLVALKPGDEILVFIPPVRQYKNPYPNRFTTQEDSFVEATVFESEKEGTPLTSGILYEPELLVIGHPTLRLGTVVQIFGENGVSAFAQVQDRTTDGNIKISTRLRDLFSIPQTSEGIRVSIRIPDRQTD